MYVVYFGMHAWSFLNITFNVRLSGLKKMEIVFIKDCSLEKFMVSHKGGFLVLHKKILLKLHAASI